MYVLDSQGEPVPEGVAGELYIGGAGVARGYMKRAELTAERFVVDPFAEEGGVRMYRTGDLGRWLADGDIEFLGRNDDQVKIRGYRIELGEIEAKLLEHAGVREAVVVAREDQPGEKRLMAYYTCAESSGQGERGERKEVGAEVLRAHLSARLPEYMVPAAYVQLQSLPLTANGKVDRRALPAPDTDAYGVREYEVPVGETETKLAEIWAELLKVERVGRHDNFFDLGGHSLLAIKLVLRIQQNVGIKIDLWEVFEFTHLSELAAQVRSAQFAEFDPADLAHMAETMHDS
jgi:acyl carrier protein